MTQRLKNKEAAAWGNENEDPEEKTYCLCNGLDEGCMISCANASCKIVVSLQVYGNQRSTERGLVL